MYSNVHSSTFYNGQDMKQSRCPLTDEWIHELWYIYPFEYLLSYKTEGQS